MPIKKLLLLVVLTTFSFAQYGNNLVSNPGFENYTGTQDDGTIDAFTGWTPIVSGGVSDATATVNTGSNAVKFIWNSNVINIYSSNISVANETDYVIRFYTRAEGGLTSHYGVYKTGFATNYISFTSTGVTGTTYTQVTNTFTTDASGATVVVRLGFNGALSARTMYVDDVEVRQKLDTLYISAAGSDAALGDADNPIATIAEALSRGFYDGGVFAFRSGDTFDETFTAGNNCTLAVYGGASAVTITTIDANSFTVTQSALINPVTDKKPGYGGFNGFK